MSGEPRDEQAGPKLAERTSERSSPRSEPQQSSGAIRIRGRMEPERRRQPTPSSVGPASSSNPVLRLSVELRLVGMVAMLWWMGTVHAAAWAFWAGLSETARQDLPWLALLTPHVLALGLVLGHAFRELPYERWSRRSANADADRRDPWPLLVMGCPALVIAPLLWIRDRAAAGRRVSAKRYDAAFHRLLGAPRTIAIRFATWGAVAYVVDAVIIGAHAGWPRHVVIAMALLWVAILGPLAAVVHGWGRSMLRPEVLSAPRADPATFDRTAGIRTPLVLIASLASAGAIAAPLSASYLWLAIASPVRAPPRALLDLLYVGGVVTTATCVIAFALIATDLRRDVLRATAQVKAVVSGVPPTAIAPGSISTGEVHDLVAAVDRLIANIRKATIAKYVAIEKAKEGDRLKSQFLANMSHDLRSPLNSILGFSELLLRGIDGDLNPAQRPMVQTIHDSGRELLQQIDDILDTAKIQAGRLDLQPQPTPPANLISRAIQSAKPRQRGNVEYSTRTAPGVRPAFVDSFRAIQALTNILLFASERVDEGTIQVSVREGMVGDQLQIFVQVKTPVSPVSSAELGRAQQGFYRVPGHRGLGLGLPIAAQILEQSHGSLSLEPTGAGMVITATMPAPQRRASWLRMRAAQQGNEP